MSAMKDKKTGKWYAKFAYKDWQGITKWTTKRGFSTKREAMQYELDFKLKAAGELDMLFCDFVKLYQENYYPRIRPSTRASKEFLTNTKILPYLGKKKLNEITTNDIVKWQNMLVGYTDPMSGKPFAPTYLKTIHNELNAIFNYACQYYNLEDNPVKKAGSIGKKQSGCIKFWTFEEYDRFIEVAMEEPLAFYCFETLYWTGIREGELLALTWRDICFESQTVSISKTYQIVGGEELIGPPKTMKGNRIVQMPEKLTMDLLDYYNSCYDHSGRVFPISKHYLRNKMVKFCKLSGVQRIRIHDIRHSHVSLLINMGYSAVDIAERVGHESITITYHYAHMFPSAQKKMANALNSKMEASDNVCEEER